MDSNISLAWLAAAVLAVWRVAHLFWGEDGPWDILVRFRRLLGNSIFGKLLDCFYCLSLWVAAPFGYWLGATWQQRIILWLAMSGGAILLERKTGALDAPKAPMPVWEEMTNEANQ